MNKREIGTKYEKRAEQYLIQKGYRILGRNVRNRGGELDLVVSDPDGTIAAVEVKYRSSAAYGDALEAVDRKKQQKICRAMQCYLQQYGLLDRSCRFDVIACYNDGSLRHVEDAFPYMY